MPNNLSESSPIFILGSPRSGTTFAVTLLNRHSKIFGFNETLFYEFIQTNNLASIRTQNQLKKIVEHLLERLQVRTPNEEKGFGCTFSKSISESIKLDFSQQINNISLPTDAHIILDEFLSICASHNGKSRWAEKTPNHVFYVSQILHDFPNAKFLQIARNPYNYLISYKYSPYTVNNKTKRGKLYHPIITSVLWNNAEKSIDQAKKMITPSQILSIRYEDLVKDTSGHLKEICAFLNIEYEESMYEIQGSNSSFKDGKKTLNFIENAVCSFICKKNILKNGYKPKTSTLTGFFALIPAAVTLPFFFVLALTSQRNKIQGGIMHYVMTRLLLNK